MIAPTRAELARLGWKYERLAALRRARSLGEPVPERAVFRSLAAEFPGCLVELDALPLEEIDARAAALASAEVAEPWMAWMAGYHALLRAALWLKPRVARAPPLPDDGEAQRLAGEATAVAGVVVDTAFVRAIAHPPRGRLVAVVLDVLAELALPGREEAPLAASSASPAVPASREAAGSPPASRLAAGSPPASRLAAGSPPASRLAAGLPPGASGAPRRAPTSLLRRVIFPAARR